MTKIALVGAGFVADYYMTTLANHPALSLAGVWDHNAQRLAEFCRFHNVRAYRFARGMPERPAMLRSSSI
jgi:predicted dehydrogenase